MSCRWASLYLSWTLNVSVLALQAEQQFENKRIILVEGINVPGCGGGGELSVYIFEVWPVGCFCSLEVCSG